VLENIIFRLNPNVGSSNWIRDRGIRATFIASTLRSTSSESLCVTVLSTLRQQDASLFNLFVIYFRRYIGKNVKYNLDDLHWQEFETLAFRAMQVLVAPGVQRLAGGGDGGRDLVYTGTSEFNPTYCGDWIFQVKHKSKNIDGKNLVEILVADLRSELLKVFIAKQQQFDVYILLTNKEVTPDLFDGLNAAFGAFKKKHGIACKHFEVIGYRHFESCIDGSESLKWSYPNIISHPD